MVRYNWTKEQLARWEIFCHVVIWPSALACMVAGIMDQVFNPDVMYCYIGQATLGCEIYGDVRSGNQIPSSILDGV